MNIGWVLKLKKGDSLGGNIQNLKPPADYFDQKGLIYQVKCQTCDMTYISETGQTLGERMKQHMRDVARKVKLLEYICI